MICDELYKLRFNVTTFLAGLWFRWNSWHCPLLFGKYDTLSGIWIV